MKLDNNTLTRQDRRGKLSLIKFVFLLAVAIGMSSALMAQQKAKPISIAVLSRPLKDSILLRWAPATAQAWHSLNKTGYHIRRFTITRNGKLLPKPEVTNLTAQPLKPLPMMAWKPMVDAEDKYGSIAAQALYGESFEVSQTNTNSIGQMINKVKENESRFSFALFSADQSFKTAKMMGLAFVDQNVKTEEKYLYKIYPAVTDKLVKIDTGIVFTGYADYAALPKPYDIKTEAQKKGVMLSWNQEVFTGIYTTYLVERSEDGGQNFVSITDAPIVNTTTDEQKPNRRAFKLDTISALNHKVYYRVKGISPFGEAGPYSDTVSVFTEHQLEASPSISRADVMGKSVKITWQMPEQPATVLSFDVERSNNPQKGFKKINQSAIQSTTFEFIDDKAIGSNYYRIKAYGKFGISKVSYAVLAQLIDSIPPAAPVQISGVINKTGIVKLSWKANTEPDLAGYRVYRSNSETGEFSQVTRKAVKGNSFTDTIEVKTLTKAIYYKLVAVDTRYNPSQFSLPLKLKRPDVVPPSPPSFTDVKSLTNGIELQWNNSSSDDVVRHEVYRNKNGEDTWSLIAKFTDTVHNYTDTTAQLKQAYTYKIRAIDESNLTSESKPFSAKRIDLGLKPAIANVKTTVDRENLQILLRWNYNLPKIESFLIYRAEAGKPLRLYQTLAPKTSGKDKIYQFTDPKLFINSVYQYRIKVIFTDGTESPFSKEISVNY